MPSPPKLLSTWTGTSAEFDAMFLDLYNTWQSSYAGATLQARATGALTHEGYYRRFGQGNGIFIQYDDATQTWETEVLDAFTQIFDKLGPDTLCAWTLSNAPHSCSLDALASAPTFEIPTQIACQ